MPYIVDYMRIKVPATSTENAVLDTATAMAMGVAKDALVDLIKQSATEYVAIIYVPVEMVI